MKEILREADIMFGLCHPNVVRIVEVIDDSRSDTNLEVLFPGESSPENTVRVRVGAQCVHTNPFPVGGPGG